MNITAAFENHPSAVQYVTRSDRVGRTGARRVLQALALLPLFGLILIPEFVQGLGDPESKSALYRVMIGPLRLIDALLFAIIVAHVLAWAGSRKLRVEFPRSLVLPGFGFIGAIAIAILYGGLHSGTNLFFDWRALVFGIGLYGVFSLWMQHYSEARAAGICFASFMAVGIAIFFATFLMGGGDTLVGVRIPVFDGPTLSAIVFTGVLASCLGSTSHGWRAAMWLCFSGVCCLLVLLSFRRTFWTELGLSMLVVIVVQRTRRGRKFAVLFISIVTVSAVLGPSFYERLRSIDPTQNGTEFSQGNQDHMGEVLDAWDQVKQSPWFGIGLGTSFQTVRVQGWKEESVMVHNAPLHVWLKYGLLGLACYTWFHFALLRLLWQRSRFTGARERRSRGGWCEAANSLDAPAFNGAFTLAALAYLAAQFVTSLGFAPWPYSSLQSTTLIVFILAIALKGAGTWAHRQSQ